MCSYLLKEAQVLRDIPDNDGKTPLYHAVRANSRDTVDTLLQAGCLQLEDNDGLTPLALAVEHGYEDVAALLLKSSSNSNAADFLETYRKYDGGGPLHIAALKVGSKIFLYDDCDCISMLNHP